MADDVPARRHTADGNSGDDAALRADQPGEGLAAKRVASLDVLRAVAVSMVIVHHWGLGVGSSTSIGALFDSVGWAGVDLFFVLSGFLVSGLIFREHQQHGAFDARRFLVRRGFKIYPAFYVLLLATVLFAGAFELDVTGGNLVSEALFIQNYAGGVWGHTWSLGIEEHFYVLLAIFAVVAFKRRWLTHESVVPAIVGLCAAVLTARCVYAVLATAYDWQDVYAPTHLRIDSLLVGVLLSYLWHYRRHGMLTALDRHRNVLVIAALALLLPLAIVDRSAPLMYTIGLTGIAIGFGVLLMSTLSSRRADRLLALPALVGLAYIGRYSYSIYLWHGAVQAVAPDVSVWWVLAFDVAVAFAVGIATAKLVEVPMLALRDRAFPSAAGRRVST